MSSKAKRGAAARPALPIALHERAEPEPAGWLLSMLACPRCGGALVAAPVSSLIRCGSCGPYPLLGDVPVLVPNPSDYCASFHDSILAALAEHGQATREAVAVVEAFAEGSAADARRFGDDWTPHERLGAEPPLPVDGPASAALKKVLELGEAQGPARWLERHAAKAHAIVEVGCGAGERSHAFAASAERLAVCDLSLRAVLRSRARAAQGDADVAALVLDAEALPFRQGSVELLVAEHVVDLLESPLDFLQRVRESLAPGGRALVTTPQPSLGADDDGVLRELAKRAGFKVVDEKDGLPWLRVGSSRFVETYLVQALALAR